MAAKQKLKRAYINVGYPRHADILSLTNRFGIQGKCASYDLILAMSEASGGVIDKDAFFYTCKINEVKDLEAFLSFCLEKRIFIEASGGYTNRIVAADQEQYAKKLAEDVERKRKANGIKSEKDRNLDIDIDIDLKDLNKNSHPASTDQIRLTPDEYDSLEMNHCNGDGAYLKTQITIATDSRKARGLQPPDDSAAYMRNWLLRAPQFTPIRSRKNGAQTIEDILAIGAKLTAQGL